MLSVGDRSFEGEELSFLTVFERMQNSNMRGTVGDK